MALKTEKLRSLKVQLKKITIYTCSMCNKCFVSENEFNRHLEIHTACLKVVSQQMYDHMTSASVSINPLKSYECKKCLIKFKNKQEYLLHAVTHLGYTDLKPNDSYVKKYKCPECDAMFVAESTLKAHGIVHDPMPHPCEFCAIGFYQLHDLQSHINVVHEEEKKEREAELKLKRTEEKYLKNNIVRKIDDKDRETQPHNFTKMKSTKKKKSKQPRRQKTAGRPYLSLLSKSGKFSCPICQEIFYTRRLTYTHVSEIHKGPGVNPCDNCHKIFVTAELHEAHLTKCLNGEKFVCDHCNKTFRNKSQIYNHMDVHDLGKYSCKLCKKRYTQGHNLQRHMQSVHKIGDQVEFKCETCDKSFSAKAYLVRHNIIHSGTRPYKCEFCDKTFSDASAKMRHVRLHTNEKPYSCKYCDKSFSDNSQYSVHIMRHENRKNYSCELCSKKFYTLSCLKKHVIHHTDIRIYECDHCARKFREKFNLRNHIYRMHLKLPYCKRCYIRFDSKSKLKMHKRSGCKQKILLPVTKYLPAEE